MILALPLTTNCVVAPPTTVLPNVDTPVIFSVVPLVLLIVEMPVAFTPVRLPVKSVSPTTLRPPPVILIPLLAVIIPTESTLVVSSYVSVPAILTF